MKAGSDKERKYTNMLNSLFMMTYYELETVRNEMKKERLFQEVQERKKFEFVETLQAFMYGWLTFYHQETNQLFSLKGEVAD